MFYFSIFNAKVNRKNFAMPIDKPPRKCYNAKNIKSDDSGEVADNTAFQRAGGGASPAGKLFVNGPDRSKAERRFHGHYAAPIRPCVSGKGI